jgi:D-lactate dehydrogenase (quinone)
LEFLSRSVRGTVRTDPSDLLRFGRDASHLSGPPVAVVSPLDAEDVVELVRWARVQKVPLVPRGAGTSLGGESVPILGGVVVDLSGWDSVLEVRPDERWARVGPGVVNQDLQAALEPYGLFFPPNPGSWTESTVGGHLGTNASGPRSYRYGATRAWVRALDAVLGTSEKVHLGSLVSKRSVGPDLLSLFVGSEGTLGIATEVWVRLAPIPANRKGIVVPLPDECALGAVVRSLSVAAGTGLSAVEYLDRACAAELAGSYGFDRGQEGAVLLLEVESDGADETELRIDRVRAALVRADVRSELSVYEDADALWTVRGRASVALDERWGPRVREDVAVPLDQIDPMVRELERIGEREHAALFLFGHFGEGSLHPNYGVDPASPAADRIRVAVLTAALDHGGTISSEHGVGALKSPLLERELGPGAVRLLRAVKEACDPDGILNPGKLYPSAPGPGGERPSPSPSGSAGGAARNA